MKNAHQRMGRLRFSKTLKDTCIEVTVHMDRFIGEPAESRNGLAAAHAISVFGGDQDIASVWSAVSEGYLFTVEGPGLRLTSVTLGKDAQCFRGSILVAGRKRPVRHLVALSAEYGEAAPAENRTILCDDTPSFVLYRLARRFGMPVAPEWTEWFIAELKRNGAVRPLVGLGCRPVLVTGTKETFFNWIGPALKRSSIRIPEGTGAIRWAPACRFFGVTEEA